VLNIANPTILLLVALMSAAFALSAWSRAGLYCNHQDLSPQFAGQCCRAVVFVCSSW